MTCLQYPGFSQTPVEIYGYPYFHQYTPQQYSAHKQNWDIVQDKMGLMYFANGDGLLSYDGVNWSLLPMPNQTMVQSLDIDTSGQIYLGAYGHFGRIFFSAEGKMHYENFSELLPDSIVVTRIYSTICRAGAVYFQSAEAVFRYQPDTPIKVWYKGPRALGELFEANGELFLKEHGKGISKLVDDEWKIVTGSERFSSVFVHFMIDFNENEILLDAGDSLWIYNGQYFSYYPTEAQSYLKRHKIYCALSLGDDGILLGTVSGGIIHINRQGNIALKLDQNAQLNTLNIREFFRDANQDIWVAMDVGLLLLEYPSPYLVYRVPAKEMEFKSFSRFNSELFAGSDAGLWKLNTESASGFFYKVGGIENKIWKIDSVAEKLLIATEFGLYAMDDQGRMNLLVPGVCTGFEISRFDLNRIYVFRANGILMLNLQHEKWSTKEILPKFTARTRRVVEMSPTEIWLDTDWTELWRIDFSNPADFYEWRNPQLTKVDSSQGLPVKRGNIYRLDDRLYFVSNDVDLNYLWNSKARQFEVSSDLSSQLSLHVDDAVIYDIDKSGNCWLATGYGTASEHLGLALKKEGHYELVGSTFDRILSDIGVTALIEQNSIWHGGFSSIVHQDLKKMHVSLSYKALIDRIIVFEDSSLTESVWTEFRPELKFQKNRIEFHYSSTDFSSASSMFYQTFLEGVDTSWSELTKETSKQYFALDPGDYKFKVRAVNHENSVSEEATYFFSILWPWYREWWAYLLFGGGFISILTFVARWRNRDLLREKEALENLIEKRTMELKVRNEELLEKTELLAAQSEKLTELDQLKTNLFANISHEFRTPLTLIKAPVDQMELEPEKVISTDEAGMIRRNADRLLRLVNQLLDLAKLDARSLQIELTEGDIFRFFRIEASSFSSLAAQKNIDFNIKIPSRQLWVSFDREKLETIIYNLLNNAFKFTPSGGKISLTVDHHKGTLNLEVSDNGPGIPSEYQELVFDRFYQIKEGKKFNAGGTGIGLSLCRELVQLMEGQIAVKSYPGRGTTFKVDLPMVEIINPPDMVEQVFKVTAPEADPVVAKQNTGTEEIILIVEDHPEMRRYLHSLLEDNYRIIEAIDGREGLDKAITDIPDLIITDTMMPVMDGHEFSYNIKNHECTSHIPILMLTAKATLENKLTGLSAGIDAYLSKPFNARELRSSIEALLLERKRLRKLFSKQLLIAPKDVAVHSLDQQFVEKVLAVLEAHYSESTFGVPQMQKALAISKTQLHRKLTAITGQSSGEFLRNFRLQRAAQILERRGESVTQVAFAVGFENVPYFTKCFKELFGVQPSRYKGNIK